jgi:hypothetical protein
MTNLLGYAASCAVLATFLMRTMVPLRLVAILSNVLFAAFGYLQHIYPVLLLHAVLLPINLWRLMNVDRGPQPRRTHGELVDELQLLPERVVVDLGATRLVLRDIAGRGTETDAERDLRVLHHAPVRSRQC